MLPPAGVYLMAFAIKLKMIFSNAWASQSSHILSGMSQVKVSLFCMARRVNESAGIDISVFRR